MTKFIPITSHKVLHTPLYTTVVLGTEDKHFAIYMEPQVGKDLKLYQNGHKKRRPSSINLIESILMSHEIKPLQVVIHDVEDSIYYSRIFLEMQKEEKKQIVEIDCRPSDSISLAILYDIPMYCKKEALDKTIAVNSDD